MRSRRRPRVQFQPPFLVGALGALSLSAGGCVELTSHHDGSGGSGGTKTDGGVELQGCPAVLPASESACSPAQANLTCGTLAVCSPERSLTCGADGLWHESYLSCNPPPMSDSCPEALPAEGEGCGYYEPGLVCSVARCDGTPGVACGTDGLWHRDYLFCNPPGVGLGGMGGIGGLGGGGSEP
jgi:hypothetical protein